MRAGNIRAYAITDSKRVESASDIPTVDEAGLPGFHMTLWSGLWVPKDTPKDVVAKLNAAAVDALNDPAVRKQLENLGLQMPGWLAVVVPTLLFTVVHGVAGAPVTFTTKIPHGNAPVRRPISSSRP